MYYGVADDYSVPFVESSDGKYTVVSDSFSGFYALTSGAQLDWVQALYVYEDPSTINHIGHIHEALLVEAISGDWSDIQTITVNYGSSSVSSPKDNLPENSPETPDLMVNLLFLVGVGALLSGVVIAATFVFIQRHSTSSPFTQQ